MTLNEKREKVNQFLVDNGFDLDQVDATYWSEIQVDEFLADLGKGLKDAKEYIESIR